MCYIPFSKKKKKKKKVCVTFLKKERELFHLAFHLTKIAFMICKLIVLC